MLALSISLVKKRLNIGMLMLANRGAGLLLVYLGLSMLAKSFEGVVHLTS
jgi:hypothetical protein